MDSQAFVYYKKSYDVLRSQLYDDAIAAHNIPQNGNHSSTKANANMEK